MSTTATATPKLRSLTKQLGDAAVTRLLGLPRASTSYTVSRVRIPMRDGIHLVADHYAPTNVATSKPADTLLVRGPYGRGLPYSVVFAKLYAARGYHVVLQSVRGTFGSAGQFEPMINEAADGADTVEWLRRQPWFTGKFGTIGVSYLGFAQWALLADPPPELAAAVITAGPHDLMASVWGTGAFTVNDFLGWSNQVSRQQDSGPVRTRIRQLTTQRKVTRAARELPMGAAARALLGSRAPWFESWVEHSDHNDPFWDRLRFPAALDRVRVPVLLVGGWQDIFLSQTLQQYRQLRDRDVDVALTVGPWTHKQLLSRALARSTREALEWLDTHLGGAPDTRCRNAVRVFVTGLGWRHLTDWPPPTAPHVFYLQPEGSLRETAPAAEAAPATFRYDPADPTPTTGGPLLTPSGGYRDDSRLASRDDVLTFTGAPLTHDVHIYGNPLIELTHSSDNPNVDVFVRVSEVDARGRSRNVSDGYRRLGNSAETITIELDAVAHRFNAGARVRVLLAGSWFPRYARNLGTPEPVLTGRQLKPATHVVHFGTSRLVLPVGRPCPSADGVADSGRDVG
ncbi:CocE/NonD family hydrolase [Mycobacterium sp.]|uniref:CocE/NonD family hydrolase n=1 Tax=Mycobacterium sp. TaxID=1785 RepID=UPI003BAB86DD